MCLMRGWPKLLPSIGSLELFLHREIGVDADAAIAYLPDGRRITSGNIRDLGSTQDQVRISSHVLKRRLLSLMTHSFYSSLINIISITMSTWCYGNCESSLACSQRSKVHLFAKYSDRTCLTEATDAASTTPPIRHAQIGAAYARTAQLHHEHTQHLLQSLALQHQALQIASGSLDFHILAISETFDGLAANGRRDLEKQASLLDGLDADLELITRVSVHVEFCSAAVRMAVEGGERHRVLADYVSRPKMKQVADTCAKTHGELLELSHSPIGAEPVMLQTSCSCALARWRKLSGDSRTAQIMCDRR